MSAGVGGSYNLGTLRDIFVAQFGPDTKSARYRAAQRRFTESMAGYSLVCYFLQIKVCAHLCNAVCERHFRGILHLLIQVVVASFLFCPRLRIVTTETFFVTPKATSFTLTLGSCLAHRQGSWDSKRHLSSSLKSSLMSCAMLTGRSMDRHCLAAIARQVIVQQELLNTQLWATLVILFRPRVERMRVERLPRQAISVTSRASACKASWLRGGSSTG
jgi:hypothetical protein